MQYYDMETIGEPAPADALGIREISAGATDILTKDGTSRELPATYRMIASHNGDRPRLIVDVDLGGTALPIDMGTWATWPGNQQKAAEFVATRVREIRTRRDAILAHLGGLRSQVEAVLARTGGLVGLVGLRFWPIEGSDRLDIKELRFELEVEQFGGNLERKRESYHGYGVRELTGCIRKDRDRQRRMAELRRLLDAAELEPALDQMTQLQLAEGRTSPERMAERIIANARENSAPD